MTPKRPDVDVIRAKPHVAADYITTLKAENERLRFAEEEAQAKHEAWLAEVSRRERADAKARLADELAGFLAALHGGQGKRKHYDTCPTCNLLARYRQITEADNG